MLKSEWCPLISNSSSLFSKCLGTVRGAPPTISIMFHIIFSTLARFKYLSIFAFFFTLWSARMTKTAREQYVFFFPGMTLWLPSVSVGEGANHRIPLSVLALNPHKRHVREISHETGRTREGRSLRSVDKGEQKKTVGRRGQSRDRHSQLKGFAETNRQNRSVMR